MFIYEVHTYIHIAYEKIFFSPGLYEEVEEKMQPLSKRKLPTITCWNDICILEMHDTKCA